MPSAQYILVGGFLGAGKTTAIMRIAEKLSARGKQVGLVTNDQSMGLVDTALLTSRGFATAEVTGGCFCCKFDSLVEASEELASETPPDVFIAEPVGSCTDLKATVSYPLRRMYGDAFRIAPLSVLVDPVRAQRILGLDAGKSFSPKVQYIYRKQLEEAEAIVINKCDAIDEAQQSELENALRLAFPGRMLFRISAREGTGVDAWLDFLMSNELGAAPAVDMDYDTYAEGEALLGWLNATVRLSAEQQFNGNEYVRRLGESVHTALMSESVEIAHLKMTLMPEGIAGDLAVANLVRTERALEMPYTLEEPLERGTLLINLRAEADPEKLRRILTEILDKTGTVASRVETLDAFRPGRPNPTHRLDVP